MAEKQKNQIMSAEEVQQAINGGSTAAITGASGATGAANFGMTNPNGYQVVDPLGNTGAVPQSAAWRNVRRTGNAVTDYRAIMGAQPGAYQSQYQPQIGQTMNNLLQQRPFQYDVNTDALYQQIKDNYIKQGRQAMMDTQGASAALTGGYGNSYGAQAGQQAYQESLGALADRVPELYQLAYNRYLGNENSQRQNLAALQGLDESEYQRYQYDTQQFETRLADAYAKYKAATASRGGGTKKKDPRSDAEWFYNYSTENGYDPDVAIDATAKSAGWTPEYTEAVRNITHGLTDYKKAEARKERAQETINTVLNWTGLSNTKKP